MATDRLTTELADVLDGSKPLADFMASVAHDAMQPITAALMLCEALSNHGDKLAPEDRARFLTDIEHQLEYLRDLCLWSAQPFRKQQLQLGKHVNSVAERCRSTVPDHEIVFEHRAGAVAVSCEPVRFESAIRNLVKNAANHSPAGSPIEIDTAVQGEHALVNVTDRGDGIPADAWDHIFEPRVRLDPKSHPGSGMGLFSVRRYASGEGGDARVARSDASGTTFSISLPLAAIAAPA